MAVASMSFNLVGAFKGLSIGSGSSSFLRGDFSSIHVAQKVSVSFPMKSPLMIESAHKKKLEARRTVGIRQAKGLELKSTATKLPSLAPLSFASVVPSFIEGRMWVLVSVYPRVEQPENPNSYRARKRESFRLQRERRRARRDGLLAQPQLVLASTAESTDYNPACQC
ncbi:Hypothetical predicted protein [Olea europaea subsp. europaea]|uniref:Uncharacterized protein n=1 Tax=Olea europaea subsp. europaea TaxID=158383 RepID=A0A8S0TTD9_OLEEU|nr:Hypothetical predicted protein [Olea europaea subsp. europaea]